MIYHEYFAEQQVPLSMARAGWDRSARLSDRFQRTLLSAVDRSQQGLFQTLIDSRLQPPTPQDWQEFLEDARERTALFMDALGQHGDSTLAHAAEQDRPDSPATRADNPLLIWQDTFAQQTLDMIDTCCQIQAATNEYWLDSFSAPTVPLPPKPASDVGEQTVAEKSQPKIKAASAPEKPIAQSVPTPKAAVPRRAAKPKAQPTKGASKPTAMARKAANNTSGKNASAETAKQTIPTPPVPLKIPNAGAAPTPHTEAAAIAQPPSADDTKALAATSDKHPDPQS